MRIKTLLLLFISFSISLSTIAGNTDLLNRLDNESLDLKNFDAYKRELAISFVARLSDKGFYTQLRKQIAGKQTGISLQALAKKQISKQKDRSFQKMLSQLDLRIRQAKGIENYADELLEVRLALPEKSLNDFKSGPIENTLTAFVPSGNEKNWEYIEAFDIHGELHLLDPCEEPDQPVLVVGINSRKDLAAGVTMVNDALRASGLQSVPSENYTAATGNIETTKLNAIRLKDDMEPWISGKAEVYAIVSGVQPNQMEAQVTIVDMPYLDYKDTTYYPNQILVFWNQYRYAAANIVLYEKDDNYNYQELINIILNATAEIMATFPETSPYSGLVLIANKIIQAMPDEWFTNNDDYVDVFYTLEKGRNYTNYYGASANARVSLAPYILIEN